jgi:hypothetical protein
MGKQYNAGQFIEAIKGSGGIVSTVAKRVGCDWSTARRFINTYPTVKAVYDDECERTGDMVESVIITNIKLAAERQQALKEMVDTSDAKWYAARKLKNRGYSERQEVTGADGGAIPIVIIQKDKFDAI